MTKDRHGVVRSKFIKKSYDLSDRIGKEAVKVYFRRLGVILINCAKDDGYRGDDAPDLSDVRGTLYVECEHKPKWTGKDWPYATVHGLERKAQSMLQTGKVTMAIVSRDASRICIIPPDVCQKHCGDVYGIANRRRLDGEEKFFDIPLNECFFDDVIDRTPVEEAFFDFDNKTIKTIDKIKKVLNLP